MLTYMQLLVSVSFVKSNLFKHRTFYETALNAPCWSQSHSAVDPNKDGGMNPASFYTHIYIFIYLFILSFLFLAHIYSILYFYHCFNMHRYFAMIQNMSVFPVWCEWRKYPSLIGFFVFLGLALSF